MSKDSVAVSDPPVDLEKGMKQEEVAIVDPLKAKQFSGMMVTLLISAPLLLLDFPEDFEFTVFFPSGLWIYLLL